MADPRFFIDHGAIHDRVTGRHVRTSPDDGYEDAITACCWLLNHLDAQVQRTLNVLHDIGGSYTARRALGRGNLTPPLRASMQDKALSDEQVEKLSLDTWESVVIALQDRPPAQPTPTRPAGT